MAIIILYTWTVIFTSNPAKLKWFALHPSFQVLALGFFVWGIVTLQPTSLSQPRAKAQAFSRHQSIMLAMGFPIIVAGTSAVIWNRTIHPGHHKGHFTTWHGVGVCSPGNASTGAKRRFIEDRSHIIHMDVYPDRYRCRKRLV
jgi:cytochrome b-561 domain-containing protein 2